MTIKTAPFILVACLVLLTIAGTINVCKAQERQKANYKCEQDELALRRKAFPDVDQETFDRIMKQRSEFSVKAWKESLNPSGPPGRYLSREALFRNFLKKYDLIGMTHKQVISLLGVEDTNACYTFLQGDDGGYGVYIAYEEGCVKGWKIKDYVQNNPEPLITTDVVWAGNLGGYQPKYISEPKKVGGKAGP